MSDFASGALVPDLYVLLDVEPEAGLARTARAKGRATDRFEQEALDFHQRVNEAFRKHIKDYPSYLAIDANREPDVVGKELLGAVSKVLGSVT